MKDVIERSLGTLFGLMFIGLSVLVSIETVARKLFNFSLQGVDELGGYALAVGGTIAFTMALLGRNHIRVDVFHEKLPSPLQALLNWLSVAFIAAFALLMAWLSYRVLIDTLSYNSVAATPWATPLKYPQFAWLVGQVVFGLGAVCYLARATWLLARGSVAQLNRDFHPRSVKEELKEELTDLEQRSKSAGQPVFIVKEMA